MKRMTGVLAGLMLAFIVAYSFGMNQLNAQAQSVSAQGAKIDSSGSINGELIYAESKKPAMNFTIILGRLERTYVAESDEQRWAFFLFKTYAGFECNIDTKLISTTDTNGRFSLSGVPTGKYIVFYYYPGTFESSELNGLRTLRIVYKPWEGDAKTSEFFATFGDFVMFPKPGKSLVSRSITTLIPHYAREAPKERSWTGIENSSVFSLEYFLMMEFNEGMPPIIEVKSGETTQTKLEVNVTPEELRAFLLKLLFHNK